MPDNFRKDLMKALVVALNQLLVSNRRKIVNTYHNFHSFQFQKCMRSPMGITMLNVNRVCERQVEAIEKRTTKLHNHRNRKARTPTKRTIAKWI